MDETYQLYIAVPLSPDTMASGIAPGALNIKIVRDVPIGSQDPCHFPYTIETPFQTKVKMKNIDPRRR